MEHPPTWARPLAWSLHAIGLLLCLAPLIDLAAGVGSLNPGEVPWRFGALGLLSGALVLPLLGFGLILIASVVLDQLAIIRMVGVTGILLLVATLATTVMFGLDALQIRAQVPQAGKRGFDLATIKAVVTYAMEAGVLAVLSVNALRAARTASARRGSRRQGAATLIVPQGDA